MSIDLNKQNIKDLEFDIQYFPQTSEYNCDCWELYVPHDIFDSADEIDNGFYRVLDLYKEDLERLYKLIGNEIEKQKKDNQND